MMITYIGFIPPDNSGKAMGIYGLSEDLGGIIAASTLSVIFDWKGSVYLVKFISIVLMSVALICKLLLKENDTRALK